MSTDTDIIHDDFPFIEWWGARLGSFDYYIEDQKARAKALNAPNTAIYCNSKGDWKTIHDISSPSALAQLHQHFGADVLEVTR